MKNPWPLSTILVTGSALSDREAFVSGLQLRGYLVLEAHSETEALEIARLHSRPIQVMLADEDTSSRSLAEKLRLYRPHLRPFFIDWNATENHDDALAPHLVQRKLREILEPNRALLECRAGAA